MNADDIRAAAALLWPEAMQSPLAQAMHGASAMALLEASDADEVVRRAELRALGREQAEACLAARGGWTVETLIVHIECATDGELDEDECEAIARDAITNATGGQA